MRPPTRGLAGSVLAVALLLGAPALASAQTDCSTLQDPAQYSACLDQHNRPEHHHDHHHHHDH
ncbi:hypothetical protein LZ318_30505 [Saccharopolyspora indica]|uniref:hypothetical protein n=1 Tax=Saccharopolyspora indica TaxID=1229659 RepID=UPI0022EB7BD5|nr:hypothetical protein [Saccharopolyspora indica]MDA3644435.1 hypothetical protein [Saccharopolyspora indica]